LSHSRQNCGPFVSIGVDPRWVFLSKNFFEYLSLSATLSFMRNYRRFTGDGSVKVVLSGDSNSPPKTTPRREPPSYNSSPTQEVCPSIPAVAADVRLTYSANGLHDLTLVRNLDQTCSSRQSGFSSSGLCDLCVFVFKGKFPSLRKFQKKPVFARIRGLCDSHPAPEKVDYPPLPILDFSLQPSASSSSGLCGLPVFEVNFPFPGQSEPEVSAKPGTFWPCTRHLQRKNLTLVLFFNPNLGQNVDSTTAVATQDPGPWPQNFSSRPFSFKKARKFAKVHVSTSPFFIAIPCSTTLDLGVSLVIGFWPLVIPLRRLYLQKNNSTFLPNRDVCPAPSQQNSQKRLRIPHIPVNPSSCL
jgi:hypothetical protein